MAKDSEEQQRFISVQLKVKWAASGSLHVQQFCKAGHGSTLSGFLDKVGHRLHWMWYIPQALFPQLRIKSVDGIVPSFFLEWEMAQGALAAIGTVRFRFVVTKDETFAMSRKALTAVVMFFGTKAEIN